jgi:chromosome segregation ATPase
MFMAFSMMLYATHRDWKDEINRTKEEASRTPGLEPGLKQKLDEIKAKNAELKSIREKAQKDYDTEQYNRAQVISKLEAELKALSDERKKREEEYVALLKAEREAVAAMKTAQENAAQSESERTAIDGQVAQAIKDREAHLKEVSRLTEKLHELTNDSEQLQNRMTTLSADLARAKEALR